MSARRDTGSLSGRFSNLTYLVSQGWIGEDAVEESFTASGETVIPLTTTFYVITAADKAKIGGQGEFTISKLHGIKIEATGQNIITVGDGNQIDAQFGRAWSALGGPV